MTGKTSDFKGFLIVLVLLINATMLFECGIEVKDAQDLLGHSTAAMTQDIYTHIRDKHRESTADLLNQKLKELEAKKA